MQPIPYIFFKSGAREAFETYGRIFGNPPEIMSFSDMPVDDQGGEEGMGSVPPDTVMHAAVKVGDGWIYGSDDAFGTGDAMAGCNIHVEFPTEAETRRVWDALADGGAVRMQLEPTFWAPLFGTLSDRFGIRWMIGQAPKSA